MTLRIINKIKTHIQINLVIKIQNLISLNNKIDILRTNNSLINFLNNHIILKVVLTNSKTKILSKIKFLLIIEISTKIKIKTILLIKIIEEMNNKISNILTLLKLKKNKHSVQAKILSIFKL